MDFKFISLLASIVLQIILIVYFICAIYGIYKYTSSESKSNRIYYHLSSIASFIARHEERISDLEEIVNGKTDRTIYITEREREEEGTEAIQGGSDGLGRR